MKKKIMGADEALRGGVKEIRLADGRIAHPLRNALEGRCTVIR
jgi:acetylglutamate/LysW-gamma-L-alpha-aminoadipate kinase